MDGQKPVLANIPITKKHYNEMTHKINTDKLRDMLREVIEQLNQTKPK